MYKQSADYDEETLQTAISEVEQFEANYGGTEIFTPMKHIFDEIKSRKARNYPSHIYLLTDGAVYNN